MIQITGINPNMIANNLVPFEPTHPGEVLREEIECRGITQTSLASELGVAKSLINELVNGKRDFTIEYALMLEAALGIDADFWINMQTAFNKNKVTKDAKFIERLSRIRKIAAML
ncbi:MAG: HigA family addiction module antidote protein [Bacteroidales bacterium]|nr:HigA family addiction module antidote protein [Bacteroidales bacterium]MBD5341646.1 HigA family addiction module antidote protein [Bacteroides sp.]MDE6034029.1 HigA family addiction module antidote protein [Muribaculaceae bacterium]MDE6427733.1 HigA family addiction module antidote protein [Muribaculaceae bacterium]